MEKPVCRTAVLALLGTLPVWAQTAPPVIDPSAQSEFLDSTFRGLDDFDGMVRKSLFGGGSKPVSFSGEALFRFIGTSYEQYPSWMQDDRTESKNGLASLRLAMVAAPHKNLRLWSKVAFNSALYGTNSPTTLSQNNWTVKGVASIGPNAYTTSPQTGFFDPHSAGVYEDMSAGLTAAIGQATTMFRLGGVLWTEASPLTVWRSQNRLFGWDYVPYELEQPAAQYYEYATSKGERTGRAAWNKKPFQGFQWESMDLPGKLYFELTMGSYEGFQKWEPWAANTANTNGLMYTDVAAGTRTVNSKGTGIGDLYRRAYIGRVALGEIPLPQGQALPVTLGANYVNFKLDNDYAKQFRYAYDFGGLSNSNDANPLAAWGYRKKDGVSDTFYSSNHFLSFQTVSIDARQTIPGKVGFLVDVGMSQVDTSYFKVQDSGTTSQSQILRYHGVADSTTIQNAAKYDVLGHRKSSWTPAVVAQASNLLSGTVGNAIPLDIGIQSVFAPKDFYSGTSFIMPGDFFFPYEANLVGAGKFAGYDGGTPYVSNMTGANLTLKYTKVPNGHLRMNVGYHTQLEKGSDLLWIPWRLNGAAFKLSLNQSSTQYDGQGLTDDYLRGDPAYPVNGGGQASTANSTPGYARQVRRFGNDFFFFNNPAEGKGGATPRRNTYSPTPGLAGGLRNDFLSTFENFGAFRLHRDSAGFRADTAALQAMAVAGDMPQSTKATQNLSFDYGQDISPLWEGKRPMFLGLYVALNGVTTGGLANPSSDATLLSGYLVRFEPVYQLSERFWLIGLAGNERWYSRYGVAAIDGVTGYTPSSDKNVQNPKNWYKAPIDYTDWAVGAGFDWGVSPRVELHTRLQYFTHRDDGISYEVDAAKGKNDFEAWYLHAETKMWF